MERPGFMANEMPQQAVGVYDNLYCRGIDAGLVRFDISELRTWR